MKKIGFIFFVFMGAVFTTRAQIDSIAKEIGNKTAELA
jgi:hypothetical protein